MYLFDQQFVRVLQDEIRSAVKEALNDFGPLQGRSSTLSDQRYLTRQQVAAYLGIGLSTVDYWARIGKLQRIYINDAPRFDRATIDQSAVNNKKHRRA